MEDKINDVEELDATPVIDDTEDETVAYRYSITSYGADYPVDGLVSRLNSGKIYIPKFQRQYVWKINQASRFIESLLLGLPVPGVFLSKDPESSKLLVIDGQQRLKTIQFFINGVFENERRFRLKGVQEPYDGVSYEELSEDDKISFNDYVIHATIIQQDEPTDDQSSIYHIFERLNTGGTPLQPQEIRACIFYGEFNELLAELNQNSAFRNIYGKPNNRLKDQELILRFLALYYERDQYQKPLKGFLNKFMGKNRHLNKYKKEEIEKIFSQTIGEIEKSIGRKAFRLERGINAALYDAVMIGVAHRIDLGPITEVEDLNRKYEELIRSERLIQLLKSGTSDEANVEERLRISIENFKDVR